MSEAPENLVLEQLRLIRADMAGIRADIASVRTTLNDHTRLLVRMREDDLRLESMHAETQLRLDRIERRLDLADA
jgi:hypothetical protein